MTGFVPLPPDARRACRIRKLTGGKPTEVHNLCADVIVEDARDRPRLDRSFHPVVPLAPSCLLSGARSHAG